MEYRRLGKAGLKVSQLSLGSWVTFGKQVDRSKARELMAMALDNGINFFDNAEVYAAGESEKIMGEVIKELKWPREKFVISTKFFWGIQEGVNLRNTLNRKYLVQAMDGSLKRLNMDFVDIVYCHRPDPETPIEETVFTMHDMITQGKALYWGTSEWSAAEIMEAWQVADRHHLHKPIVEQPQYNLFHRARVEKEYARLYKDIGLGLTTWSPLASGILSGKYLKGIPEGSRLSMGSLSWLREHAEDERKIEAVQSFVGLARETGFTPSQLAIAWCSSNPVVSSVILGATSEAQLKENIGSLELMPQMSDLKRQIDTIFDGIP
ncbi:MAG: aldo/keto reductase [Bdellovibrionota bacterium]